MSGIPDHLALFSECVERMSGDEPCCLDLVFIEELKEAAYTDGAGEESYRPCVNRRIFDTILPLTSRDVASTVLALVRTQPAGNCINVDRDATESTCKVSD